MKPRKSRSAPFRGLLLFLLGVVAAFPLWWGGWVVYYNYRNPDFTPFMAARAAELVAAGRGGGLEQRWLPYEHISADLKRAVIAAEDARFLDHDGFDWDALERAARKNLAQGRIAAGGSTITNQLAKNLFLGPERTPWRKLKEAVITVMIEAVMEKRRILEIYLNVIEWGERCYGAEAAARHYFRTGADRLSRQQAALLASVIPNPRYYDHHGFTVHIRKKAAVIRGRMGLASPP